MNHMKEKLEERAVALNQILEEQNTGIQLVYTKQFSHNEECEGYIIQQKEKAVAPIVYISPKIPDWWEGSDQEVAEKLQEISKIEPMDEIERFIHHKIDRQYLLDHVYFALVSGQKYEQMVNNDLLLDRWCDLAVKYSVSLPTFSEDASGSIRVSNQMMETYDIEKEELIEACNRNMEQEVAMMSLKEQMAELLGMDTSEMPDFGEEERVLPEITVITNKSLLDGAGSILLPSVQKRLERKYGSCFAVLPSSRHEVLIAPLTDGVQEAIFYQKMVKEVNETQVEPEDFLSDHVYVYRNGNFTTVSEHCIF